MKNIPIVYERGSDAQGVFIFKEDMSTWWLMGKFGDNDPMILHEHPYSSESSARRAAWLYNARVEGSVHYSENNVCTNALKDFKEKVPNLDQDWCKEFCKGWNQRAVLNAKVMSLMAREDRFFDSCTI